MRFPTYKRIDRYRPDRRFGRGAAGLTLCWSPDLLPWPSISAHQGGDSLELGVQLGGLGPDPVFAVYLSIPRPR